MQVVKAGSLQNCSERFTGSNPVRSANKLLKMEEKLIFNPVIDIEGYPFDNYAFIAEVCEAGILLTNDIKCKNAGRCCSRGYGSSLGSTITKGHNGRFYWFNYKEYGSRLWLSSDGRFDPPCYLYPGSLVVPYEVDEMIAKKVQFLYRNNLLPVSCKVHFSKTWPNLNDFAERFSKESEAKCWNKSYDKALPLRVDNICKYCSWGNKGHYDEHYSFNCTFYCGKNKCRLYDNLKIYGAVNDIC